MKGRRTTESTVGRIERRWAVGEGQDRVILIMIKVSDFARCYRQLVFRLKVLPSHRQPLNLEVNFEQLTPTPRPLVDARQRMVPPFPSPTLPCSLQPIPAACQRHLTALPQPLLHRRHNSFFLPLQRWSAQAPPLTADRPPSHHRHSATARVPNCRYDETVNPP